MAFLILKGELEHLKDRSLRKNNRKIRFLNIRVVLDYIDNLLDETRLELEGENNDKQCCINGKNHKGYRVKRK